MTRAFRFISALGAVFFAVVGLSACGGIPGNAVVQVGGTPDHEGHLPALDGGRRGRLEHCTTGTSKTVVPEPPEYTACIAHLQASALGTRQRPTRRAELKTECEQQYKSLLQEVLGFLISSEWVLGEAPAWA